ncbi:MAG: helix-turn-helix domain-containing protein [Henriciella sp.]
MRQHGPPAVLADEQNEDQFFQAIEDNDGNLSAAARDVGLSRAAIYKRMRRLPEFGLRVDAAQRSARRRRSSSLHSKAQDHLQSLLDHSRHPLVDDNGEPVLDENFEQVMVSTLSVKSIVDVLKETRQAVEGEAPLVALQVNEGRNDDRTTFVMGEQRSTEELMRAYGIAEVSPDSAEATEEVCAALDGHTIDAEFEEIERDED